MSKKWSGVVEDFQAYQISSYVPGGRQPAHYFSDDDNPIPVDARWIKVLRTDVPLWLTIEPSPEQIIHGISVQDNRKWFQYFIPREHIPPKIKI